jgi:prepilin-type N-terminal cleavage/methylation domain-containing protein
LPKQRNKRRGFSLIEMAMVISIIGILAALSVPGLVSNISQYRLNTASRCLVADLRLSRHLALKENRSVRVNFINQRSYQIERYVAGNWTPVRDEVAFTEDQGRRGVIFPEVPQPVVFDYIGRANNPSTIDLVSETNKSRTIEVASTGRIIEY